MSLSVAGMSVALVIRSLPSHAGGSYSHLTGKTGRSMRTLRTSLAIIILTIVVAAMLFGLAPWHVRRALAQTATAPAGRIAAVFDVTNAGSATYRIPLIVPPGRRGMQPSVELVYGSQQG